MVFMRHCCHGLFTPYWISGFVDDRQHLLGTPCGRKKARRKPAAGNRHFFDHGESPLCICSAAQFSAVGHCSLSMIWCCKATRQNSFGILFEPCLREPRAERITPGIHVCETTATSHSTGTSTPKAPEGNTHRISGIRHRRFMQQLTSPSSMQMKRQVFVQRRVEWGVRAHEQAGANQSRPAVTP